MTMVLAVFWLSGSAAWASGVSAVKYVSDPNAWLKTLKICNDNAGCVPDFSGNFAGLNISIVSSNSNTNSININPLFVILYNRYLDF